MKTWKYLMVVAAVVCFMGVARGAEDVKGQRGQRDPGGRLEEVRKSMDDLGLSEEQKTQVDKIFGKAKEDMKQKMADAGDGPREKMQAAMEVMQGMRGELQAVLTDEQQKKMAEKMQEMRGGATTQPGQGGAGVRFEEALKKLDLSDDQKEKMKKILADAKEKRQKAMEDAGGDQQKMREAGMGMFKEMMDQIREVLTPEQQEKLREEVRQGGFRGNATSRPTDRRLRRGAASRPDKSAKMSDESMEGTKVASTGKSKVKSEPKVQAAATQAVLTGSEVLMKRSDGKPLLLSTLKGRPTVLVFGSYTSPSFREHIKALDEIAKHSALKANFVLVYTKEAHPEGGWEVQRNKDEEISVAQHADEAARWKAANATKSKLQLSMPMAIDTMDDAASRQFDAFPDGVVILGKDGEVVAKQKWAEPYALKEMLDEVTAEKATTRSAT